MKNKNDVLPRRSAGQVESSRTSGEGVSARDPSTPEEWQEAVDAAAAWKMIADCKMYGLLDGGPEINLERCDDILARGRERGVHRSAPVADLAAGVIRELNVKAASQSRTPPSPVAGRKRTVRQSNVEEQKKRKNNG